MSDPIASFEAFIRDLGEPLKRGPIMNRLPRVQMQGYLWHLIYERDGGICYICGLPVTKGRQEVDHLVPRSSFPPDRIEAADRSDNLRTTHPACNQEKSNYLYEELPRTNGVVARCWECTYDRGFDPELDSAAWQEHRQAMPRPRMTETAYCGRCGPTWVPDISWIL
jgi:hypothetical protein